MNKIIADDKNGDENMSRNCIKCGAEIGDLEVFCPKCGTVQNGQGANAGPNVTSTPMVKETQGTKKSTKKYIMIGGNVSGGIAYSLLR